MLESGHYCKWSFPYCSCIYVRTSIWWLPIYGWYYTIFSLKCFSLKNEINCHCSLLSPPPSTTAPHCSKSRWVLSLTSCPPKLLTSETCPQNTDTSGQDALFSVPIYAMVVLIDNFDLHVMTDKCVQVIELSHKSGMDYARCSDAHFMTSGSFFTEGHG